MSLAKSSSEQLIPQKTFTSSMTKLLLSSCIELSITDAANEALRLCLGEFLSLISSELVTFLEDEETKDPKKKNKIIDENNIASCMDRLGYEKIFLEAKKTFETSKRKRDEKLFNKNKKNRPFLLSKEAEEEQERLLKKSFEKSGNKFKYSVVSSCGAMNNVN